MSIDPRKLVTPASQGADVSRGRPRAVVLLPEAVLELQRIYLQTNRTRKAGSMTLAWDEFCHRHPEYKREYSSKHTLPTAAKEAMRVAVKHVEHHRQGAKKLRETTYKPGRMRLSVMDKRRLYAGEQASWDDATINLGVVIPWPQGGCPCSDKYGVKVGRFQLLLCHDDATGYVPSWSYVVREAQGYRGEDVAAGMVRLLRDVCLYDRFVVEGGVWQSKRINRLFEAIKLESVSAKGRPNQKLVEGFFNRLWTQLSLELPNAQVGRWRGEQKETSEIYVACRGGRKDPRQYFPPLKTVLAGLESAIRKLNARPIESRVYGKWIPEERWIADMQAHPRPKLSGDWLWLAAPVVAERKVVNGMIKVTAPGPMGIKQQWLFSGDWLYAHAGEMMAVHFDPLSAAPIRGVVTAAKSGKKLGDVWCVNPVSQGGTHEDIAKAQRDRMLREYRVMVPKGKKGRTESLMRDATESLELVEATDGGEYRKQGAAARAAFEASIADLRDAPTEASRKEEQQDKSDALATRKARNTTKSAKLLW